MDAWEHGVEEEMTELLEECLLGRNGLPAPKTETLAASTAANQR